jgi:hypothetical protein
VGDSIDPGVADGDSVGVSVGSGVVDELGMGVILGSVELEEEDMGVPLGAAKGADSTVHAINESVKPIKSSVFLIVAFAFIWCKLSYCKRVGTGANHQKPEWVGCLNQLE